MSLLSDLLGALNTGRVDLIDLTAPLHAGTPVLQLPEPFRDTIPFRLTEISRYDTNGPAWYWNDIHTGEHTGTHFDAPVHWITARDGQDVSQVTRFVAPAVVLDFADRAAGDPDFLLEVDHIMAWQDEHGPLPENGWLLYRTGWDARGEDQSDFLNGGHTPGMSVGLREMAGRTADHGRRRRNGRHRRGRRALLRPHPSRATRSCWAPASTA